MKETKKKCKILILSWELYPVYAGGLGVLVDSLVKELLLQDIEVTVLLPHKYPEQKPYIISIEQQMKKYHQKKSTVKNLSFPIDSFNMSHSKKHRNTWPQLFSKKESITEEKKNLDKKVYPEHTPALTKAYAFAAADYIEKNSHFDLILGMDWMSIPTFQQLKNLNITIPFAFYVNSTEYDRSLMNDHKSKVSETIEELESQYFKQSNFIIAVSQSTEKTLLNHFGIDKNKCIVVNNGITFTPLKSETETWIGDKNVLFLGRFAPQKGLHFLLDTAEKVIAMDPEVKFMLAGDGELMPEVVENVIERGLERSCIFTGWLEEDV